MADITDVNIDSKRFEISVYRAGFAIDAALKAHINDMANEVERRAKEMAPRGPTGRLKQDGIIRDSFSDTFSGDGFPSGSQVTDIPAFGGGHSVRGRGGRFVAVSKFEDPGHLFHGGSTLTNSQYTATIKLNPAVKHAKWVHEGTGLFGPYNSPIVPVRANFLVFNYKGRKWVKKEVMGQKPQPFLTEAFEYVRNVYEPAKLAELRAEIDAVT